ncbi:hypothetical protein AB6A40_000010 [Gnathostoma spinigerum]|uniref:Uncharacterized protein n=1 Tax=Gnathostoma spinigerum TaxID=75299 RepID=A0ABD6E7F0_9BILA
MEQPSIETLTALLPTDTLPEAIDGVSNTASGQPQSIRIPDVFVPTYRPPLPLLIADQYLHSIPEEESDDLRSQSSASTQRVPSAARCTSTPTGIPPPPPPLPPPPTPPPPTSSPPSLEITGNIDKSAYISNTSSDCHRSLDLIALGLRSIDSDSSDSATTDRASRIDDQFQSTKVEQRRSISMTDRDRDQAEILVSHPRCSSFAISTNYSAAPTATITEDRSEDLSLDSTSISFDQSHDSNLDQSLCSNPVDESAIMARNVISSSGVPILISVDRGSKRVSTQSGSENNTRITSATNGDRRSIIVRHNDDDNNDGDHGQNPSMGDQLRPPSRPPPPPPVTIPIATNLPTSNPTTPKLNTSTHSANDSTAKRVPNETSVVHQMSTPEQWTTTREVYTKRFYETIESEEPFRQQTYIEPSFGCRTNEETYKRDSGIRRDMSESPVELLPPPPPSFTPFNILSSSQKSYRMPSVSKDSDISRDEQEVQRSDVRSRSTVREIPVYKTSGSSSLPSTAAAVEYRTSTTPWGDNYQQQEYYRKEVFHYVFLNSVQYFFIHKIRLESVGHRHHAHV